MSMNKDQILAVAKAMMPAERYDLIEDLLQILDDDELSPELLAEIQRRIEASDRGEGESIPVDKAVAEFAPR